MSWSKELIDFGVVKLNGKRNVRVFKSQSVYVNINVPEDVREVRWTGDNIAVYLETGKVRRYTSPSQYITI